MIRDTFRAYRNEKLAKFVTSLKECDQKIAHETIQFIRTEFPECENAIRGKLFYEEKS